MTLIADILLAAGAFGAAVYCYVLAQRLKKFQTLENGMGGAIAVLSVQVDDMTQALEKARGAANGQADALGDLTRRGEGVAARLELLLASMHDLPTSGPAPPEPPSEAEEKRPRFVRHRGPRPTVEDEE